MSAITDAVKQLKGRLAEIDDKIGPLQAEADQIRAAIEKLDSAPAAAAPARRTATRRAPAGRRGRRTAARRTGARRTATAAAAAPAAPAARTNGRAPRGQNRTKILASIKSDAKTAGQVAKETGIGRGTVATTLTKLVSDGAAVKAPRGYRAA
jgi:hypothetical protein